MGGLPGNGQVTHRGSEARAARGGGAWAWRARLAVVRAAWRSHAALVALMLPALALRLLWPGIAELKIDEAQPLALADQIWVDHRLSATCGYSSTGLPGTPLVGYLLVLPRALTADPRAGVAFLGLLDALGVLATFLAVQRFAGRRMALVTAALYAANPWAIMFSRKTWEEIVPLFTVLALWAACEVVVGRRPGWALAFFPLLALQVQSHVMGALLLPAALLTVLLFWTRWRNRYTLWGVALGLLILLPYALVLAGQWGAIRAVLRQNAAQGRIADLRALTYALWFASGATVTSLMGQSVAVLGAWERALQGVNVVTSALLGLALGGATWSLLRRGPRRELAALLLIWVGGPLVPLVFVRGAMGVHYLLLLVPASFVLLGAAWTRLLSTRWRALTAGAGLVLAATLAIQAAAALAVRASVTRYPTEGGFGRTLGQWLQVQQGVRKRLLAESRRDLQVLGIDDGPWSSDRAVLDLLLGRAAELRYVGQGGRQGLLVPEQGDALALVLSAGEPMVQALGRYGEELERWPLPGSEWGIRLYRIEGHGEAELASGLTAGGPGTFENGMHLLGMQPLSPAAPGGSLVVETFWTYTGQGANPADMAFNHLLDAAGKRWAQQDGFALSRVEWRTGATLIQWFTIPLPGDLPPGHYWLFTGMYSLKDMSRANVIAEDGRWLSDGVRLGPISVQAGPG